MGAWKRSFLLESIIFSVHGSFAGGCWLLKHFQRFWGSHFGSILAWHETRGMAWWGYFPKSYWVWLTVLLCHPPIVTVFFHKAIFLKQQKPSFSIIFLVDQKILQKSLPWRPGVDEVFIAGGCPWSWYRSSRGEQWLLNGRKGSQWSPTSRNKNVLRGWRWYCMFGGASTTVGYERSLPCNTFLSDFYFVYIWILFS